MSFPQECSGCVMGDHDKHKQSHGSIKGIIGGTHCPCEGDCAERYQESVRELRAQLNKMKEGNAPDIKDTPRKKGR